MRSGPPSRHRVALGASSAAASAAAAGGGRTSWLKRAVCCYIVVVLVGIVWWSIRRANTFASPPTAQMSFDTATKTRLGYDSRKNDMRDRVSALDVIKQQMMLLNKNDAANSQQAIKGAAAGTARSHHLAGDEVSVLGLFGGLQSNATSVSEVLVFQTYDAFMEYLLEALPSTAAANVDASSVDPLVKHAVARIKASIHKLHPVGKDDDPTKHKSVVDDLSKLLDEALAESAHTEGSFSNRYEKHRSLTPEAEKGGVVLFDSAALLLRSKTLRFPLRLTSDVVFELRTLLEHFPPMLWPAVLNFEGSNRRGGLLLLLERARRRSLSEQLKLTRKADPAAFGGSQAEGGDGDHPVWKGEEDALLRRATSMRATRLLRRGLTSEEVSAEKQQESALREISSTALLIGCGRHILGKQLLFLAFSPIAQLALEAQLRLLHMTSFNVFPALEFRYCVMQEAQITLDLIAGETMKQQASLAKIAAEAKAKKSSNLDQLLVEHQKQRSAEEEILRRKEGRPATIPASPTRFQDIFLDAVLHPLREMGLRAADMLSADRTVADTAKQSTSTQIGLGWFPSRTLNDPSDESRIPDNVALVPVRGRATNVGFNAKGQMTWSFSTNEKRFMDNTTGLIEIDVALRTLLSVPEGAHDLEHSQGYVRGTLKKALSTAVYQHDQFRSKFIGLSPTQSIDLSRWVSTVLERTTAPASIEQLLHSVRDSYREKDARVLAHLLPNQLFRYNPWTMHTALMSCLGWNRPRGRHTIERQKKPVAGVWDELLFAAENAARRSAVAISNLPGGTSGSASSAVLRHLAVPPIVSTLKSVMLHDDPLAARMLREPQQQLNSLWQRETLLSDASKYINAREGRTEKGGAVSNSNNNQKASSSLPTQPIAGLGVLPKLLCISYGAIVVEALEVEESPKDAALSTLLKITKGRGLGDYHRVVASYNRFMLGQCHDHVLAFTLLLSQGASITLQTWMDKMAASYDEAKERNAGTDATERHRQMVARFARQENFRSLGALYALGLDPANDFPLHDLTRDIRINIKRNVPPQQMDALLQNRKKKDEKVVEADGGVDEAHLKHLIPSWNDDTTPAATAESGSNSLALSMAEDYVWHDLLSSAVETNHQRPDEKQLFSLTMPLAEWMESEVFQTPGSAPHGAFNALREMYSRQSTSTSWTDSVHSVTDVRATFEAGDPIFHSSDNDEQKKKYQEFSKSWKRYYDFVAVVPPHAVFLPQNFHRFVGQPGFASMTRAQRTPRIFVKEQTAMRYRRLARLPHAEGERPAQLMSTNTRYPADHPLTVADTRILIHVANAIKRNRCPLRIDPKSVGDQKIVGTDTVLNCLTKKFRMALTVPTEKWNRDASTTAAAGSQENKGAAVLSTHLILEEESLKREDEKKAEQEAKKTYPSGLAFGIDGINDLVDVLHATMKMQR